MNVFTNSLKILHITTSDFFKLNFFLVTHKYGKRAAAQISTVIRYLSNRLFGSP